VTQTMRRCSLTHTSALRDPLRHRRRLLPRAIATHDVVGGSRMSGETSISGVRQRPKGVPRPSRRKAIRPTAVVIQRRPASWRAACSFQRARPKLTQMGFRCTRRTWRDSARFSNELPTVSLKAARRRSDQRLGMSTGATVRPSTPLRAMESARNPLARSSSSAAFTTCNRSSRSSCTAMVWGTP
jgi:hypothetical protein